MSAGDSESGKPFWSWAGFRLGFRRGLTIAPGIMVFGLVVGAAAALAMRYHAEGGRDAAVYLGAGVTIVVGWMIATCAGYVLGGLVVDPARYGLDLVMPVFFAAMLVPLWTGRRRAYGWAIAGIVALVVQHLVPGWWFIIAGSLAGALAGAFLDEKARA